MDMLKQHENVTKKKGRNKKKKLHYHEVVISKYKTAA